MRVVMNKKLLTRKAHRYIGLIIALQLLAWTIGGIWFTWNDIDKIHGDHLRNFDKPNTNQTLISTQKAIDSIADFGSLRSIKVNHVLDQVVYRIDYHSQEASHKTLLVNAINGETFPDVTKQKAINIAKQNAEFNAKVKTTELLTATDSHHEYRNKPLPAWAITFDHPESPTFYVSTKLATLTSVRHNSWRIFDFLWMLHTMDYQGRDDFGNWLIKIFSLIALLTAISGIILFFISRKKKPKET